MSLTAEELAARLVAILERTATEKRPCRYCGVMLYFVPMRTGKIAPYTGEGRNHFEDCPYFAKRRAVPCGQESLFPHDASGEAFDPQ